MNRAGHKKFPENEKVFIAKDNKQIKEIWDDITEGAEVLQDAGPDSYGYMIKRRKLSDGTIIQLRKKSDSGGSTIEINSKTKIHNIKDKK